MKWLVVSWLGVVSLVVKAQNQPLRLHAIGVDGFKNLPFMVFSQSETVISGLVTNEKASFYNPTIGEVYVQLGRANTSKLITLGLGYASLEHLQAQRLQQRITGIYLKLGREHHSATRHKAVSFFWGYYLTLSRTKAEGNIVLDGEYFPSYTTAVPSKAGGEAGVDLTLGAQFVLLKRLQARLLARNAIAVSAFGNRNYPYLAGQGVRLSDGLVSATGGATVQLFYLIQPRVTRNSTN